MRWRSAGRALKYRNYRLFFAGQGLSLIGTWMQQVATAWLVYRLSGSALLLGLVGFAGQFPTFLLAPLAGVLSDRWDRRRTLLLTQSLALGQAALLAVCVLGGWITIGWMIVFSAVLGAVNAFDIPTRQAFLPDLVGGKENLTSAIALNSSLVNGARLVGPALAGLLIALAGEGACFLVNALSYLAVLAALLAMDLPARTRLRHPPHLFNGLREGAVYAFGFRPVRDLLLFLALVSLSIMPLQTLLPVFAKEVLGGGPDTLGLLTAASGLGALAGALYLASRSSVLGLGRQMAAAALVFGTGLIAFSWSRFLVLSLLLLLVTGFAMMLHLAASNTLLQTIVDEDKRGRVMSFYAMAFMGTAPLGSLAAGSLADCLGAPSALRMAGAACLAGGMLFALRLPGLREHVRPIYIRLGLLPPATVETVVAEAVNAAKL